MARWGLAIGISAVVVVFLAAASWPSGPPARRATGYFPAGQLRSNDAADVLYDQFYASTLASMRLAGGAAGEPAQPSLFAPSGKAHDKEYRAIVSHGRDYLMAIRVFQDGSGIPEIVANRVELGSGGRTEGISGRLDGGRWSRIFRAVESAGLWRPPHAPAGYRGDCQDWLFEAREGPRYALMSATCTADPVLQELEAAFLAAAGWSAY